MNFPVAIDPSNDQVDLDESALYSLLLQTYGDSESNVEVTLQLQHEASNDTEEAEVDQVDDETDTEVNEDGIPEVNEDSSQNVVSNRRRKKSHDGGDGRRPLYSCNRCERIYTKKHSVLRHLRYECGVDPQFQCSICPQRFKHRSDQQRHERKIHGVEGVFDIDDTSSWFTLIHNPLISITTLGLYLAIPHLKRIDWFHSFNLLRGWLIVSEVICTSYQFVLFLRILMIMI